MIIDDNFLDQEEIKSLQDIMYADPNSRFPWYYDSVKDLSNMPQFIHMGFENEREISPFAQEGKKILEKFCNKNNIEIFKIINIQANLFMKDNQFEGYKVSNTNIKEPHLVFLYYVNDSDGDIVFFNQRYSEWNKLDFDKLHTAGKVSPVSGRAVVFDGLQKYGELCPTDNNFKCVISISFDGKIPL